MSKTRRELIQATIEDMVSSLLYYDRKEDAALPRGAIEEAVELGEITCHEMVGAFRTHLNRGLPPSDLEPFNGVSRIYAERTRQISEKDYSAERDDGYTQGQLAWAAVAYAAPTRVGKCLVGGHEEKWVDPWPWNRESDARWKGEGIDHRIMLLTKAGALIAAEIDRLLRKKKEE